MAKAPLPADSELDPDLLELRRLHRTVPPVDIKYELVEGQRFLLALRQTAGQHPVSQIAQALGVTTTTIYSMRTKSLIKKPKRWPTDRQMAGISRAWTRVKGRGRNSREHLAVHVALTALLDEGFVLLVLARRMKVPVADLEKFLKPPAVPQV